LAGDTVDRVLLGLAAAAWCVAVVAGLALIRYRRPDIPLLQLWFGGWRWFRRATFRPDATPLWRLFIGAACLFAAGMVIAGLRNAMR
jgi:hypothetical protein